MSPINYIRRKSENLTTAIEQIYGLRVNNEPDKCLKVASETFSSLLNMDLSNILELDVDTFLVEIIKQDLTGGFIQKLSEFMLETAEIYHLLNKPIESKNLKKKSLKLLQYQNETDKTYSYERIELIKTLQKEIDEQII
jgi:hypothetical protein